MPNVIDQMWKCQAQNLSLLPWLKSVNEVALAFLTHVVTISSKLSHKHICGYCFLSAVKSVPFLLINTLLVTVNIFNHNFNCLPTLPKSQLGLDLMPSIGWHFDYICCTFAIMLFHLHAWIRYKVNIFYSCYILWTGWKLWWRFYKVLHLHKPCKMENYSPLVANFVHTSPEFMKWVGNCQSY